MSAATKALPQFSLPEERDLNHSSNMDTAALDFDLLAEYLLEDVGNGGFDFGVDLPPQSYDSVRPSMQQPTTTAPLDDHEVVTPHHSDSSYAEPLIDVSTVDYRQTAGTSLPSAGGVAASGAPAAAPSQAQTSTVMAAAQPAISAVTNQTVVPTALQQPVIAPPPRPVGTTNAGAVATVPNQLPAMRQPQQVAPTKAPVAQPPRPTAVSAPSSNQSNKRPRVSGNSQSSTMAKASAYSFAGSNTTTLATAAMAAQINKAHPMPPAPPTDSRSGEKSQAQVDRRRERNRILARRTRLRKKFFFESLQKDVADLQRENAALKSIVRSRLKPGDARSVLDQCDAHKKMPGDVRSSQFKENDGTNLTGAAPDGGSSVKKLDREDFSLIQSIQNSQQCFIISDPSLHDNPIVYASDDFLRLVGYSQDEVLGRNCRFLQGTETCQEKVAQIRKAVAAGEDVSVTFVNYTSDGKRSGTAFSSPPCAMQITTS
mmetsp:Transcript_27911/g.66469  ORF Transcript_27911/g.66469 Transcript_27911/m.66469 type:complete len:485 (+) Transcript_27911:251-1705(+)